MRLIAAIAGILISIPPLIFFWIGAQTFIRPTEKALATFVTIETAALLIVSAALLFTPAVQRLQLGLLLATIATVALILMADRLFR